MTSTSFIQKSPVVALPVGISEPSSITGEMLRSLRQELGQSLSEFGLTLKRAADPRAERGYTRQYISRLEHNQDQITPELAGAFWNLAAQLDEVPFGLGGAVSVQVLAQPGQIPNGAYLKRSLHAQRCKGCNVLFIGPGKFHDPDCRKSYWSNVKKLSRSKHDPR